MTRPNLTLVHGDYDPAALAPAKRFGVSMIPFTPVSFSGASLPWAILRLGVYGALTYMTWAKYRKLSYVFAGATVVSAATSALSDVWNKSSTVTEGK